MAKKRKWDMSNPLYRYLHKKKAKTSVKRAVKLKRKRRTGVFQMARRGKKAGKRGMMGGMGGISSILKSALIGIGGAHVSGYVPINVQYKEEVAGAIAGYALGGKIKGAAIGAGAVFLAKQLPNLMNNGANATTGGVVLN